MLEQNEQNFISRIPPHVHMCMTLLGQKGYEAYLVGGAVRDLLLGDTPADFDLATDAVPQQMLEVFAEYKTVQIGIKHGTITVIVDGKNIEITTYRTDGAYLDSRRPDSVIFSQSLEEDVKRRDFTINALAMDSRGQVIDIVGGREDLSRHIIRSVGDPDLRLKEDALRIMRALRFASVLGFAIEEQTQQSMWKNKDLLLRISSERIWSEFIGLICGSHAAQVMKQYVGIIGVVIPEILPMQGFLQHNPHHNLDVWEHTVIVIQNTPPQKILRLAALFHDCGKPSTFALDDAGVGHFYGHPKVSRDVAHDVLVRMKADTRTREQVETLVLWHDIPVEPSDRIIRRRLHQFGEEMFKDLLVLKKADTLAQSEKSHYRMEELERIQEMLEQILESDACFSMEQLTINGDDLLAIGVQPGKQIGHILEVALHAVMDGEIQNDRELLLVFAKKILYGNM